MVTVVVLVLLAALANAGALVLQRKTALGEPAASSFSLRGCARPTGRAGDRRGRRAGADRRRNRRGGQGCLQVLRRGDRPVVDVPDGPRNHYPAGAGQLPRPGLALSLVGTQSAPPRLCGGDLPAAQVPRARRSAANDPDTAIRANFCSRPWRSDSPSSACTRYSSPDTAECIVLKRASRSSPSSVVYLPWAPSRRRACGTDEDGAMLITTRGTAHRPR